MKEKWRGGGRSRLEYVCGVMKMLGLWWLSGPPAFPVSVRPVCLPFRPGILPEKGEGRSMDWEWMAVQRLGAALVGVLLGSLLPAEAVARWRTGRGTRTLGLRPGAYDTARRFGAAAGALVLLGDAGKTAAACAVARAALPELGGLAVIWAGLGAVAGHCYSFWHRGRGGPGTAVLAGWVVLCLPFTGVLAVVGGAALTLATGYLPLGAVAAPVFAAPIALLQYGAHGPEAGLCLLAGAVLASARQRPALRSVLHGAEPPFYESWDDPDDTGEP